MKRLSLLLVTIVSACIVSCSAIGSATSSNTVATASGASCGTAVAALYKNYKSTGKIDMTNPTNITNILTVATCYTQLKENKDNASYQAAFCKGLVSTGGGVITTANATNFMNTLLQSSALAGLNSANIAGKIETVNAIIALLKLL